MRAEPRHAEHEVLLRHSSPTDDPSLRTPWGVAGIALVAALLQIVASVALGMAKLDAFAAAAGEAPHIYMVVAALLSAAVGSVWLVRERPAIAVALAILWPVGLYFGLRTHVSGLALAYHGEFILHHFSAVLCGVLALAVPILWATNRQLGPLRWLPLGFAAPGTIALAMAHVAELPGAPTSWTSPALAIVGGGLLLFAWPAAVALFWRRLGPPERRAIALILLLPVAARLAIVGPPGLAGELVPDRHIVWLGAAMVITAIMSILLLRPRLDRWVLVVVGMICLLGSMFFYYLYQHGFGELEDGLAGLLQSLFGFQVPYPSYVNELRSAALMMGLFFMSVTVYASLVSGEDRIRGVALGLMVLAGLGFSSPHLVLMVGVGALLFIDTLLPGAPFREVSRVGPLDAALADFDRREAHESADLAAFEQLAHALTDRIPGLTGPTTVELETGVMVAIRGELDQQGVDIRARIGRQCRVELTVGLTSTGQPLFELVPDSGDRGQRPAHVIARSHRVVGDPRGLERLGDPPLDALNSFPRATLRAWEAGTHVDLGTDLRNLRVDTLESLVRALARPVVG